MADEEYLRIRNLTKLYGNVVALDDCSLTVRRGELLSLLGPSGCGKSTLLSLIGGLDQADKGEITLAGRSMIGVPSNQRNVGIVFQSYALFPHMTVRENVSYGLRMRREKPAIIAERVDEVISLLKLDPFVARYPAALSGGQQQRVAVARALAIRPDLMLLDEALSALDKNLREEMQIELSLLLRRAGTTAILVTHDQREAFTFGDRVAVMSRGVVHQVGPAEDVYLRPATDFVLDFLGSAANFPARLVRENGALVAVGEGGIRCPANGKGAEGDRVRIFVRSDDIQLSRQPTDVHKGAPGQVTLVTFLGAVRRHVVDLQGKQVLADLAALGGAGPQFSGAVYLDFSPEHVFVLPERG